MLAISLFFPCSLCDFFSVRSLPVFLFSGLCFWLSLSRFCFFFSPLFGYSPLGFFCSPLCSFFFSYPPPLSVFSRFRLCVRLVCRSPGAVFLSPSFSSVPLLISLFFLAFFFLPVFVPHDCEARTPLFL